MSDRFVDRVALVTGAGRGIGKAIADRLSVEGAAEAAVAEILARCGSAVAVSGSVADDAVCQKMVSVAKDSFGTLDIVVNNAGLTADAWVHRMPDDVWALTDDVMLKGTFQVCRSAARLLRLPKRVEPRHHRKVVNITSINGIYGVARNTNYSAAKGGIIGFTKALAREWASQRINVNAVAPGFIEGTRLSAPREEGDSFGLPADVLDQIRASMPLGRVGHPEDIAAVVAFLASSDADFVTGQVIEAHGGREIIEVI